MPSIDVASNMNGAAIASENAKSVKVLDELLSKLNVSKTNDEASYAAGNLASFINGPIEENTTPVE
jgi:elongation factor 3